jgi:hypothetical protein
MTLSYDKYWTIIFDKDNTILGKINTHKEADAFCIKYPEYSWEYAKNVFNINEFNINELDKKYEQIDSISIHYKPT